MEGVLELNTYHFVTITDKGLLRQGSSVDVKHHLFNC